MRIANVSNRLVLLVAPDRGVDVETASGGRFPSDPQAVYGDWPAFREWAAGAAHESDERFEREALGAPAPRPRQVFAVGLNYGDHIAETGSETPDLPLVFTKFVTSITGPYAAVEHPGGNLDWEVELVAVIGTPAHRVEERDAWAHVAGVAVGQDLSERVLQHNGTPPQFSLGKSYPGFGPIGPCLVTPDELRDPDDLEIGCTLNGESVQHARTSLMLNPVAGLVSHLSSITPLLPGDVIFTGTPAGVGLGRSPQRFLSVGDELVSFIEGIGEIVTRIVAPNGA